MTDSPEMKTECFLLRLSHQAGADGLGKIQKLFEYLLYRMIGRYARDMVLHRLGPRKRDAKLAFDFSRKNSLTVSFLSRGSQEAPPEVRTFRLCPREAPQQTITIQFC